MHYCFRILDTTDVLVAKRFEQCSPSLDLKLHEFVGQRLAAKL